MVYRPRFKITWSIDRYADDFYLQCTMNLVNIISGIFIVDPAYETMHKADKTGGLNQEFTFRANTTAWWPTVPPSPDMIYYADAADVPA